LLPNGKPACASKLRVIKLNVFNLPTDYKAYKHDVIHPTVLADPQDCNIVGRLRVDTAAFQKMRLHQK
jgi:hypothetical protein